MSSSIKVNAGDTLDSIADKLGKGYTPEGIFAANRELIGSNPANVAAGMILVVPDADELADPADLSGAANAPTAPAYGGGSTQQGSHDVAPAGADEAPGPGKATTAAAGESYQAKRARAKALGLNVGRNPSTATLDAALAGK